LQQLFRRMLNLNVSIFSRPAFDGKQRTPMDTVEIAVEKFVAGFGLFAVAFIDAEVPLGVLTESV
jgi:hypothetical protein